MVGGLWALMIQGVFHLLLVAGSLVKGLTNCNLFVLFGLLRTWFCLLFPSLSPPLFLLLSSILFHSPLVLLFIFFFVLCSWFCLLSTLLSFFSYILSPLLFLSHLVLLFVFFFVLCTSGMGFGHPHSFFVLRGRLHRASTNRTDVVTG